MNRKLRLWAGAFAVVAAIGACSSGGDDEGADGGGGMAGGAPEARPAFERGLGDDAAYDMATGTNSGGSDVFDTSLPPVGPAVIKTAGVTVRVGEGDLQAALRRIVEVARAHGGFVQSTAVEEEGGRSGTVVIRVPAESFEDALADAQDVGEVVREQVSGQDVSQEFVDLDARLRNFEAQESVLLDLMAKSESVADTLRVQRELQDVQLEIERLRGRLRYLRDQTDLSTITLTMREEDRAVAGTGLFERAWQRAVDTFSAILAAFVVGLSVAIPVGLLIALVLLIARFLRPRLPTWGTREG